MAKRKKTSPDSISAHRKTKRAKIEPAHAVTQRSQQNSRLLALPAELRNLIHEYCCDDGEYSEWATYRGWKLPGLAAVNQQLRREFMPMYARTCGFWLYLSSPENASDARDSK